MKRITLIVAVASTVFATSCKRNGFCKKGKDSVTTETRQVENFTTVNSEGSFDIFITQDESLESGVVIVEAPSDLMKYIKSGVSNGVLTIDNSKCFRGNNDIQIYVSSNKINDITLSGSGNIKTTNTLSTSNMRIELDGSGDIETDLQVSSLDVKIKGSGNINSYGEALSQNVKIKGSGNINHFGITSEKVKAAIEGSGNIELNVSESLDASIDGSGNISYKGTASVTTNINGSGSINNKN